MFITKPDERLRPLGVAALEDKILQRAVVEVLNAVYEQDFVDFSYGFHLKIPLPDEPPADEDPPGHGPPGPDRPKPSPTSPGPLSTDLRLRSVHALRVGRSPVGDPDPNRARARHRRAQSQ